MKLKTVLLSFLAGSAAIAAPAFAHDDHDGGWHRGYGYRQWHPHYYAPVVVAPAPRLVYAPPPAYYAPVPVYPAPVAVAPGLSIRLRLPL